MNPKALQSRRSPWPLRWGGALALLHAVFYFWVMSRNFEGSWGGFVIFLVDLPGSFVLLLLSNLLHTPYVLLVGGCVWWFLVGWTGSNLFILIAEKTSLKRKQKNSGPLATSD